MYCWAVALFPHTPRTLLAPLPETVPYQPSPISCSRFRVINWKCIFGPKQMGNRQKSQKYIEKMGSESTETEFRTRNIFELYLESWPSFRIFLKHWLQMCITHRVIIGWFWWVFPGIKSVENIFSTKNPLCEIISGSQLSTVFCWQRIVGAEFKLYNIINIFY